MFGEVFRDFERFSEIFERFSEPLIVLPLELSPNEHLTEETKISSLGTLGSIPRPTFFYL